MSTAAPAVAGAWMRFALRNSSQVQPWSAATLERTALKARHMIAQIARAVPDIDGQARSWVAVAKLQR